jgi:hypothetical protein
MLSRERLAAYATDPAEFRRDLVIEVNGLPANLCDVIEPWQEADFAACDAGLKYCIDPRGPKPEQMRAYLERARGHSKTSDIAIMCSWAMSFAPRMVKGYAAAADRDQARLVRNAIAKLLQLNPLLAKLIEVQSNVIVNICERHPGKDSTLEIVSNDVGSSYGITPDFIICDELTHWGANGDMWNSLFSSAAKRDNCLLLIISNAGANAGDSWQWTIREFARLSAGWHFSSLDGPQASWITAAVLEEQRLLLPGSAYQRLWLNIWVRGGDALEGKDVDAAVTMLHPLTGREHGLSFVAGLDIGVKNDRSALVSLAAAHNLQRVQLANSQSWSPGSTGEIDLTAVEEAVFNANKKYRFKGCYYDPSQAQLMAQRLRKRGVKMIEVPFVGQNLTLMASTVMTAFRQRRIDLYDDPQLIKDLGRLNIASARNFGYKLEAARNATGHADTAIALAIALPYASELAGKRLPGSGFAAVGHSPV